MEAGYKAGGAGGAMVAPPVVVANPGNVIRAPGLKRGKTEEAITDRIKLESVLGLTVGSNAGLDCDPNTELVAYPAGCTVVLYNVRKNRQSHIINASRKSVTCVAFSPDGRYLATGECGHAPAVRVWDLQDPSTSGAVQIAEFPGHTHGVSCVAFSTSSKYLVSVGSQHDMIVNVWDWRANLKLASNKVSSRVKAVSFSESGNYFVTVGFRHVKFWYLEYSRSAKFKEPVPLMGRSAILGEQKDNEFCDVKCGRGECSASTFAITRNGLLCEFNSRRLLDKWVELRTTSANCLSIGASHIFVGCAEGIVRCFSPTSLRYVTTLPRTHYLGVDVARATDISHMYSPPPNARYPDALALTYDDRNHKLTCVYNDHSLYVWDVRDIKRVGKSHSALYHAACIWGVEVCDGSVLSCSSDDTVRMWSLGNSAPNIYSNELTKIIYTDPELKFLKDVDLTTTSEKDKSKTYDDKIGVRCVAVSTIGHIAAGDRAGNVVILTSAGALLRTVEAHDAEVLCLEYSAGGRHLLASASRDRLIHVFDVDKNYQILQTLDDHSSSITAVRFLSSNNGLQMVSCGADKTILFRHLITNSDGTCHFARGRNVSGRSTLYDMEVDAGGRHILTACQDRNVRVYSASNGRHTKTFRGTTADEGTLIKVALDSSGIYLATSCTDKVLSVYDYYSGECMAAMCGHSEIVTGLRFTADCQNLISASGDGCIFVWRVPHDMVVTMRARLAQQAMRHGKRIPGSNGMSGLESESESHMGSPPREIPPFQSGVTSPVVPDYTLRIGRLPSWAKKSLGDELVTQPVLPSPDPPARGKWARRIQHDKRIDSDGSKDSSIDSGTDTRYFEKRREQNSGKQRPKSLNISQLSRVEDLFRNFDEAMAKTQDILSKVTINLAKPRTPDGRTRHHTDDSSLGSFKYEDQESTEHDGDIEDISDGERTSSSERGTRTTYYPGNNDEDTPSEFMVNAMDVEELRQSMRRSGKWRNIPKLDTGSVTGTSPSPIHSDEDEASTPSGDNADRNPLSGSCESLDASGKRDKYLKSAFESLSGAELDTRTVPKASTTGSLSSQHLSLRPAADAIRTRDELQRRIAETRKQLESVAYRSNLKSSQSTTDLSYIPEKDGSKVNRARPVSMVPPNNNNRSYGLTHQPEENFDSLNSNYFDSLNYTNLDYRNKNPYAIPANMNYKTTDFGSYSQHLPNTSSTSYKSYAQPNYSGINKDMRDQKGLVFTVDMSKTKHAQAKGIDKVYSNIVNDNKEKPSRNFQLNLNKADDKIKTVKSNTRSIFKNYKSCPVSPVSEECKWSDKAGNKDKITVELNAHDAKKRNSLCFFVGLKDNGKNLVDTIKSDTQKMIAEITKKYGDLDDIEPINELDVHPTKDVGIMNESGNFSSDSLEDCSYSQDASCKNKLYSKRVCKKHAKTRGLPRRAISNYEIGNIEAPVMINMNLGTNEKSSTLPRNMPSNLDNIDENYNSHYSSMYRCQSVLTKRCITRSNESVLSDNSNCSSVSNEIFLKYGNEVAFQQAKLDNRGNLDDSYENVCDPNYIDKHRHSSASFFLNQKKYMKTSCSQDSVLSDEMYLDDNQLSKTNCNSLESVLSDDSEYTKSAPLEMLFEGAKPKSMKIIKGTGIPRDSKSCYEFNNTSKSYGSSPNKPSNFGYLYNNYIEQQQSQISKPSSKVYGFEVPPVAECSGHSTITRSKSLYENASKPPPPAKNIAYYFDGSSVQQYSKEQTSKDEIPRLGAHGYMDKKPKSLQPQFVDKYKSEMEGCEQRAMVKSKSCSFEVVLEPASKPNPLKNLMEKRTSHVKNNLEKFEEQIKKNAQNKVNKNVISSQEKNKSNFIVTKSLERGAKHKINNNKVTMDFVPHKPPKPIKRSSSAKINNRLKSSDKTALNATMSSNYKAKLDGLQNKNYFYVKINKDDKNSNKIDNTEKTFDMFIKEKDINENKSEMQMDSLEVYAMQKMERMRHVSLDSLDLLDERNDFAQDSLDYFAPQNINKPLQKTNKDEINRSKKQFDEGSSMNAEELSEEVEKYKSIERKLEIINKLVEMEERKILQEKILKEWRMQPLKVNLDDGKGVVKVLSKKFETLAKQSVPPNLTSLTLEEVEKVDEDSPAREIKRNRSLPDILDKDQIGCELNEFEQQNVPTNFGNTTETDNCDINISNVECEKDVVLNNTVRNEENTVPKTLKCRVYNEMVIPKTDVHLDSENYESSTTSSSCTNSPKRLSLYGFNRIKTPILRKSFIRIPTPRLCMENRMGPMKVRPILASGVIRSNLINSSGPLAKRMSLQSVGLPAKFTPVSAGRTHLSPYDTDEQESSGMRRAISLSDLAVKPMPAPRTPQAPAKPTAQPTNGPAKGGFVRPAPRYTKSNMVRSSSVGVLNNQSDSESDPQPSSRGPTRGSQGLMRPTISSMNKAAANNTRRRGLPNSYSTVQRINRIPEETTVNLSTPGQEESSSDAEERPTVTKPAVPPRPRAVSIDHSAQRRMAGRSGSEKDLSSKAREVTARLTANTRKPTQESKVEPPSVDPQLSSTQLCSALTEQLTKTASKVVQLYRRLQQPGEGGNAQNQALVSDLEAAMLETQKVLRGAVVDSTKVNDSGELSNDLARMKLDELVAKEGSTAANNPAMSLIEQYSDILLNMMQSKIVNQYGSLPPTSNNTREPANDS